MDTRQGHQTHAIPIRFCSRWGLPCRPRCRGRGALLPHPFTLTRHCGRAVCFLWHFPWGRPRRALPGTVRPWSPDFPLHDTRAAAARSTDHRQDKAASATAQARRCVGRARTLDSLMSPRSGAALPHCDRVKTMILHKYPRISMGRRGSQQKVSCSITPDAASATRVIQGLADRSSPPRRRSCRPRASRLYRRLGFGAWYAPNPDCRYSLVPQVDTAWPLALS